MSSLKQASLCIVGILMTKLSHDQSTESATIHCVSPKTRRCGLPEEIVHDGGEELVEKAPHRHMGDRLELVIDDQSRNKLDEACAVRRRDQVSGPQAMRDRSLNVCGSLLTKHVAAGVRQRSNQPSERDTMKADRQTERCSAHTKDVKVEITNEYQLRWLS